MRRQTPKTSPRHAFTLMEMGMAFGIVAVLSTMMIVYIANYVTTAKRTADKQTCVVLNDAIAHYTNEGGDLTALTVGKPFSSLITKLATPVTWYGLTHQFWRDGEGVARRAMSISASGSGRRYHLTRYNNYQATEVGTPIPLKP